MTGVEVRSLVESVGRDRAMVDARSSLVEVAAALATSVEEAS